MNKLTVILVIVLSGLVCAETASGTLIVNGSFEQWEGEFYPHLQEGSTMITGWVVSRGAVDWQIGGMWQAADGECFLDLDGNYGPAGGVAKTLGTTPGQSYSVSFDMAANVHGNPTLKQMRVTAAGQWADFTFDSTGHSNANMGWEHHQWQFTAVSSETTLEFYSLTTSTV